MTDILSRLSAALEDRYTLEHQLGEGGMATVYLAEDLKHKRKVALKVLKPELAAVVGAERFLAEIETTANLQHPHILPLHDSGEADSFLFYVMPYIEGETLGDRLARERQLPVDEAVKIAVAVAGALDYAHRKGVIHRDIKPGNILMQDGQPVVADFGIALAVGAAGGARLTETGLSVGTPYYMSPEQATGDQVIGPSSDVYALASVLYEMLVGEPPFPGATAQAVLGKIIAGEKVSATQHRASIPLHVDAAIRRALEKLPADRFTTAEEFAKALEDPAFAHGPALRVAAAAAPGPWKALAAVFAAATVVLGGLLLSSAMGPDAPERISRFAVGLPEGHVGALYPGETVTISPTGDAFVYTGPSERRAIPQLWIRQRTQLEPRPMAGTEEAYDPSFSPDGQSVAYLTQSEIRTASLGGEPPVTLATSGAWGAGLTWADDGYIYVFDAESAGIGRVPDSGGEVEAWTTLDEDTDESFHFWPEALPDGAGILFIVAHGGLSTTSAWDIAVADPATGEHKVLADGTYAVYSQTGHLVYLSTEGTLLAAPFDLETRELTGPAVALFEGVAISAQSVGLDVAPDGTLVYWSGEAGGGPGASLVWVDRDGTVTKVDPSWTFDAGAPEVGVELSPDGTRAAIKITTDAGEDIWVKELDDGPLSRLTFDPTFDRRPRWSKDGTGILFTSDRGESTDLWKRPANGTGPPELVLDFEQAINEVQQTPDEEWWILRLGGISGGTNQRDLVAMRRGDSIPTPLVAEPYDEKGMALSPDGRWLAYESTETGRDEVYVRPFPDVNSGKWQVSSEGGHNPRWSKDGTELFFVSAGGDMTAVDIAFDNGFRVRGTQPLFSTTERILFAQVNYAGWDVNPDGSRFLMVQTAPPADVSAIVVVENFSEELKAKVGR